MTTTDADVDTDLLETLRSAADRLTDLRGNVTGTDWVADGLEVHALSGSPNRTYPIVTDDHGDESAGCVDSDTARFIAAMNPRVADALVAWLRVVATDVAEDNYEPDEAKSALEVAQAILASDSVAS